MQDFLECVRAFGSHAKCREESKAYILCRMNRNLMQREKLEDIGFGDDAVVVPPSKPQRIKGGEFIPGMDVADQERRKKKGTSIFG